MTDTEDLHQFVCANCHNELRETRTNANEYDGVFVCDDCYRALTK